MAKDKDLAVEYALARLQGRLSGNEVSFCENKVFTEGDIETAFNAGRKSMVENIPELKWKDEDRCGDRKSYIEISYSSTPFGDYSILLWYHSNDITIYFNGKHFKLDTTSVQQAKDVANEDYKKRIKQVLGL